MFEKSQSATFEVQQVSDLDFFEPIVLHYIARTKIDEAFVQETDVRALCGEEWIAYYADHDGSIGGAGRKTVICPLCGDVYAGLGAASV